MNTLSIYNGFNYTTKQVNKFVARAFGSKGDKQECKLRRGLKVTFYVF